MTGVEIIMFFTCRCFFMFFKKQSKNEKELPERLSRKHMMVIGIVTVILVILIVAITLVISFSISADKRTSTTSSITTTTTTTTTTGKLAG
jgi:NADH:ubiquinone oxidoreductase subunit 5 (subunit L)/multisubunit Na+/H+ antiporter MnhA subunit